MTSGRELGRSGARWTTTTKAIPLSSGTFRKKCSKRLDSACRRAEPDVWKVGGIGHGPCTDRSEEHTSELQSLMRTPYAVFCLKKKKNRTHQSIQSHISRCYIIITH